MVRTVNTEGKVQEVWFTKEDAQESTGEENQGPSIDRVELNPAMPKAGHPVNITLEGSDPEGMALSWDWTWTGPGLKHSGSGEGAAQQLSDLPTPNTASAGDVYTIDVTLMDALGAFTQSSKSITGIKANEPPVITKTDPPSRVRQRNRFWVNPRANDPDGNNAGLTWSFPGSTKVKGCQR